MEIVPSIVPESIDDVLSTRNRYAAFTNNFHIDAADGVFASNKTWMPRPGEDLPERKTTVYEVHMMVENPLSVGVAFARAGAQRIIGHVEAFAHADAARDAFTMWKGAGAKEVGLALLLSTSLDSFVPYANICQCVTVMSIATIGVQGLPFDERGIDRVKELHARYPRMRITVDGGVNVERARILCEAGATRLVAGSVLSRSEDPAHTYSALVNACA